jgi:hypothetical protein
MSNAKELSFEEVMGSPQNSIEGSPKELSFEEVLGGPEAKEPEKGFVSRVVDTVKGAGQELVNNPAQAALAGGSAAAEAYGSLKAGELVSHALGGDEKFKALGKLNRVNVKAGELAAKVLPGPLKLIAPLVPSALGMAEFAGASALAHEGIKAGEGAVGVGEAIEEAQAANPNISTTAGTAVMGGMAAKSLKGYKNMLANEGLGKTAIQAGGAAVGGAAFPYIDYGTRKGINAVAGEGTVGEIPVPTSEDVMHSARDMAILGGMGYKGGAPKKSPIKEARNNSSANLDAESGGTITGTSEEILGQAEAKLSEAETKVTQAADVADQSNASETARALRETISKPPAKTEADVENPLKPAFTGSAKPEASRVDDTTTQLELPFNETQNEITTTSQQPRVSADQTGENLATSGEVSPAAETPAGESEIITPNPKTNENQIPQTEPLAESTPGETIEQLPTEAAGVLPGVPEGQEKQVADPLSSADAPNPLGVSAASETPVAEPPVASEPSQKEAIKIENPLTGEVTSYTPQESTSIDQSINPATGERMVWNDEAEDYVGTGEYPNGKVESVEESSSVEPEVAEEPAVPLQDRLGIKIQDPLKPKIKKGESQVRFSLTTYTDRITKLKELAEQGRYDEIKNANRTAILSAVADIPGVRVGIKDALGVYAGGQEVSAVVTFTAKNEAELGTIRSRMAAIAQHFEQMEVIEEGLGKGDPQKLYSGTPDEGGYHHVFAAKIETKNLTPQQLNSAREKAGFYAFTLDGGTIEIYDANYTGKHDPEFRTKLERLHEEIADLGGVHEGTSTEVSAIRGYSEDPAKYPGTTGYTSEEILLHSPEGRETQLNNPISRRLIEMAKQVYPAPAGGRRSYHVSRDLTKAHIREQAGVGDHFEALPSDDLKNPVVEYAYKELANELGKQYDALTEDRPDSPGTKFYFQPYEVEGEPYKNSSEVIRDIRTNNRLKVLKTDKDSFGPEGSDFSNHPLLEDSGRVDANGVPLSYNDLLRAVHDAIAHGMYADQFGPVGEEGAWNTHIRTLDNPWARWALTTETRGQNSWINFNKSRFFKNTDRLLQPGEEGYVPIKDRPFADQKAALLPLSDVLTGDDLVDAPVKELMQKLGKEKSQGSLPPKATKKKANTKNLYPDLKRSDLAPGRDGDEAWNSIQQGGGIEYGDKAPTAEEREAIRNSVEESKLDEFDAANVEGYLALSDMLGMGDKPARSDFNGLNPDEKNLMLELAWVKAQKDAAAALSGTRRNVTGELGNKYYYGLLKTAMKAARRVTSNREALGIGETPDQFLEQKRGVEDTGFAQMDDYGSDAIRDEENDVLHSLSMGKQLNAQELDEAHRKAVEAGDMETAQRLVNEAAERAGYDIDTYHGTKERFNKFRESRLTGLLGKGIYQAKHRSEAENYTKIRNEIRELVGEGPLLKLKTKLKNPYIINSKEEYDALLDKADKWYLKQDNENADSTQGFLKSQGYDGVIDNTVDHVVAHDSNQVKLSDPVTYDDQGNVIPLSQRFNFESDDIRYARGNQTEGAQERGKPVQVTHAEDVLQRILKDPRNDSMTMLVARHLLEKFGASGRLRSTPVDVHEKLETGILGEYNTATKRIALETSSDAETALEEVLHSLTADKKLPREIKDLFTRIRNEAVRKGLTSEEQWTKAADPTVLNKEEGDAFHYAFSDPHELLAAALKNRSVRDALNDIQIRDTITGRLVSAWKKLRDSFKKMLGFQVRDNSALDQYLNRMFDHMADRGEISDETRTLAARKSLTSVYNSDRAEVTLNNLNQNIYEPDRVPQISSSPSDGDSFQAAESVARGSQRPISDAQTAEPKATKARPGNRIFTSPEEAAAKADRLKINQTARPLEESALREWAEKNGKVINSDEFARKWEDGGVEGKDGFKAGAEHAVYFDPAEQRWVKTNNLEFHGSYLDYLQRMMIHNQLFPDTAYTLEGFTDFTPYPQPGTEKRFQPVVSQGHIKSLRGASRPEVVRDMDKLGFRWVKGDDYISDDGTIRVEDLHDENAVVVGQNKDGSPIIAYIDPVILLTPETKASRVRKVLAGEKKTLNAINVPKKGQSIFNQDKKTTALDEPEKTLSPELQKALGDTSYVPFKWKEDAGQVSKWLNDAASANGTTWEKIAMDLMSEEPVSGISERQKLVGKFMLTKSLDNAASDLRKAGKAYEAARYNKLAKTLYKTAKLDASAYGQGLNTVKMLTELVSGNTALSEYIDPIAKVHHEKLSGRAEVADILGTLKGARDTGAEATVAKANPLLEKLVAGKDTSEIGQIVKEALLNPDSTVESLTAELADAGGVTPEKAAPVAEAVKNVFTLEARKSAKIELDKLVKNAGAKEERAAIKKVVESDAEKLLKLVGMGAFSEEKYYNAIAKTYDLPSWDPVFAKSVEKEGEKIAALPQSMKDYRQQKTQRLMGEIAKKMRAEKLNNKDTGEIADLLTTFWQLGVLSGPPTQVVNAVASGASVVGESLVEATGAALKTGDTKHIAEVFSGFLQALTGKGGAKGLAGQEFSRAFKEGTSKYKNSKGETLSSMETLPDAEDLQGVMKLFSTYGNKLKYVGRSMAAFDSANMAMAELAAERRAARYFLQTEKGLKGEALESGMKDLFDPESGTVEKLRAQAEQEVKDGNYADETPADQNRWVERRVNELLSQRRDELTGGGISEAAIQAAERFTYNDDARGILGQFAGFMNQINQETKVSKFVISFMKTMMNLVNQTVDWSPYGYLRGANKSFSQTRFKEGSRFDPYRYTEGSTEQYAQYARATIGTLAWAGLAYLAYKGLEEEKEGKAPVFSIHGAGPTNSYDKQQLLATRNWQPNSIRIGGHWLRYTDWPILGMALGGMGSFFDSLRYAKDESTTSEKLFAGAMATASTVLDKNMLQGVSNLFEGIRQSSNSTQQANALKRLISGAVGGFTNPGMAKWARNSFYADKDGMVNRLDQSTLEGWAYSMVPFSIGYNTPALNTLGEPLQQPWYSATMWRFADVSGVPPHPIITPLVKSGLMLPNPSKNTEFRYLDKTGAMQKTKVGKFPEINRRFVELRGQAMKEMLTPDIVEDLSRMAKQENLNEVQSYLDSRIGGAARKYAIAQIEQEIQDGKLRLD